MPRAHLLRLPVPGGPAPLRWPCPSQVALGGLAVRGYELAAVTWEQAFLMCPASPDEGQGAPLRPDMLIEGIFGLSLSGLRRGTLR